jgi:exodeoxyribonuclease-5
LLADLLPGDEQNFPESPHWVVKACASSEQAMDTPFEDAIAPAVLQGEKVNGGTWLLRSQAICPAWAYFQYRLGAGKLKQAIEGLDPAKRGSLVHDALEYFWTAVANSTRFKAMSDSERKDALMHAIDQALNKFDQDAKHEPLKPRFRILERQRIGNLLSNWLVLEASRAQPFTVIANEREVTIEIEGIKAKMEIDRIDLLEDGRLLVIDYKTGAKIDYKNWASQRITEPQLPIYAAIEKPPEGPVAAVVFGKVLMDDAAFAGVGESEDLLQKLTALDSKKGRNLFPEATFPDWASVLQHWDSRIHAIAREVKTGDARICFEDEKLLEYCEVKPLLRLAERNAQMAAAGSAETDAK